MRGDDDLRGRERQGDIVLTPGQYVYSQDESKGGAVKTFVGPCVITPTGQDRPVKFDPTTRRFNSSTFEAAIEHSPFARKGQYIILDNPATEENQQGQQHQHPNDGQNVNPARLSYGNTVNVPGPITFALWPGQSAVVVDGHTLRSNEYLEVEIVDKAAAQENWESGIIRKPTNEVETEDDTPVDGVPEDLAEGKIYIIRGDQVAFYIPPTGVRVVPDEEGNYVRDAVTLETLEYCQLFDENGNKRYERGPQVVFPEATEQFEEVEGNRKFRATELNEISGLHVKVIAPYNNNGEVADPSQADHKEGDELFITGPGAVVYPEGTNRSGQESAIYFPRVEHSILKYGKKKKHYATSIPHGGEGRYLMDRKSGVVETIRGPKMLLPDPRTHVIVRRPLSDRECRLWYPTKDGQANPEVLAYNRSLRMASAEAGTERAGYVSDSDYASNAGFENLQSYAAAADMAEVESRSLVRRRKSRQQAGSFQPGDEFERGTTYTPPRSITLDTKFESVPTINVWTGYAVMVVSKSGGDRQCHVGPKTILLDYDQTLEVLSLSTGKPKNTDRLEETVYLRVLNNKVSDIVDLETSDHIPVQIKLSLLIDFDGDENKWFDVENYVKFATDHVRSILKGVVRKTSIEVFDKDGVGLIRDTLLGVKPEEGGGRPGMSFEENGMVIRDVEVLDISIQDTNIRDLLKQAQHKTVVQNIKVRQAEDELAATQRQEQIKQNIAIAVAETASKQQELERDRLDAQLKTDVAKVQAALAVAAEQKAKIEAEEANTELTHNASLARQKAKADQEYAIKEALQTLQVQLLQSETTSTVERFRACQEGFSEALLALGSQETVEKVAQALSVQQLLGGNNFVEVVEKVFKGSPLEGAIQQIGQRAGLTSVGTNSNRNTLSRASVDGE